VITGTSDRMERQVFPVDDNRCQQSREPGLRPEPIASQLPLTLNVQVWSSHALQFSNRFTVGIYRGSSVFLCGSRFHFYCRTALSYICVT